MDLPVQFGRYQLLERIAQGGMADVFLARTFGVEGFEKRLVVKRILPGLSRSPRFVSMFINEAKISVSLNHPNIVQVYELGKVDADYFIAMEHIHGRDLTRLVRTLRAQGQLVPLPLAVYVVASALRGLDYAHALVDGAGNPLHIVHGDVSPHNLVVSFAGEVKLVDFGIARVAGTGWGDQAQHPGGGKFAYMSPEQASGLAVDRRSDIFAAGIVLYELLVGHRLFQHPDPEEKLRLVREAIIPDPREENHDIPDDLWQILSKVLARDPADRYQSAGTFEEDLRAFLFANRLRGDTGAMAAFMAQVFEGEATANPATGDLRRLAEDLRRLNRDEAAGGRTRTATGEFTSSDASVGELTAPNEAETQPADSAKHLPRVLEELKSAAVLTVEVVGFTDALEDSDPTLIVERQREVLAWFRKRARRFGGYLLPATDDVYTFLFGVPKVREDDLERALACALDIRPFIQRAEWLDTPAQLCMGVHHGDVAIVRGTDGVVQRVIGRGDTLKQARLLAASAEVGEIRVSDRVAELAFDDFHFDEAPAFSNRHRSFFPWTLLGRRARAAARDAGRWLVRGDEIELLGDAMEALGRAEGRVVVVSGETGVGKSRLIQEVGKLARKRGLPFYKTRAYPFGADRPMATFRDLVAEILGMETSDGPAEVRRKLARLTELRMSDADIAVVSTLFAVQSAKRAPPGLDLVLETGRRLVAGLAEDGPVALVVEDAAHLDRMERNLLQHVVNEVHQRPILLLISCSTPVPAFIAAMTRSVIRLKPLPMKAYERLVADLLGVDSVDPGLVHLVSADAGGNPLFVAELVKVLEQEGHIIRDDRSATLHGAPDKLRIPHTLRGVIAARIDALDPASKGLLQLAATIGMHFPGELLAEAAGMEAMDHVLDELLASGLLLAGGDGLEFASQLVWDVAAHSTLGIQKRDYHRMVANGLKRLYTGHIEPHLDALARHEAAAGSYLEAARHVALAGEIHRKGAFLERALACYEQGLDWLQKHRDQGDDDADMRAEGEVSLQRRAGEVAELLGKTRKAERFLQLALDQAEEQGMALEEAATCLALGRVCMTEARWFEAQAYLEQARAQAETHGADDLALDCLEALAKLRLDEGDLVAAEKIYELVLERAGPDTALAARALLGMANRHIQSDDPEPALQHLQRALDLARSSGDRILLGRVVNNIGIIHHMRGDYEEALSHFRKALEVRKGVGYRVGVIINLHNIGDTHFRMGDHPRAWAAFEQSATRAREVAWRRGIFMNEVFLGYLMALRGEADTGEQLLVQAIAEARRAHDREFTATGLWLLSRWHGMQDDSQRADDERREALELAERCGAVRLAREIRQGLVTADG